MNNLVVVKLDCGHERRLHVSKFNTDVTQLFCYVCSKLKGFGVKS